MILVNGAPWNMLRLDQAGGAIVEGKRVGLPMGLFRPGRNQIAFQPILELAGASACPGMGAPAFSLFETSRVVVPAYAELALQPDLGRVADLAFPLGPEVPGVKELVVSSADPATIAAAWTLMGKLAQVRGAPLTELHAGFAPKNAEVNLLVVGPADRLPPHLASSVPVGLPQDGLAAAAAPRPTPAAAAPAADALRSAGQPASDRAVWTRRLQGETPAAGNGPFESLLKRILSYAHAAADPGTPAPTTRAAWDDGSPRDASFSAFRSPYRDDRTILLATAADAATLQTAVATLVGDKVWPHLEGSGARWNVDGEGLLASRTDVSYLLAPPRLEPRELVLIGRAFLSRHPGWWLALVGGLLALLALATRHAVRRRLETRL
jgi:hypothetical protein